METHFRYCLQKDPKSLRRFTDEKKERWDARNREWTHKCADERSCQLTSDREVSADEALAFISLGR